jgi:DNA-binding IscR family transcriptional regulator
VEAIDGEESAFRCTEIRRRGPTAVPAREYRSPCGIHRVFTRADEAWRAELAATTVSDLVIGVIHEAPRPALEKAARWIEEAVR